MDEKYFEFISQLGGPLPRVVTHTPANSFVVRKLIYDLRHGIWNIVNQPLCNTWHNFVCLAYMQEIGRKLQMETILSTKGFVQGKAACSRFPVPTSTPQYTTSASQRQMNPQGFSRGRPKLSPENSIRGSSPVFVPPENFIRSSSPVFVAPGNYFRAEVPQVYIRQDDGTLRAVTSTGNTCAGVNATANTVTDVTSSPAPSEEVVLAKSSESYQLKIMEPIPSTSTTEDVTDASPSTSTSLWPKITTSYTLKPAKAAPEPLSQPGHSKLLEEPNDIEHEVKRNKSGRKMSRRSCRISKNIRTGKRYNFLKLAGKQD